MIPHRELEKKIMEMMETPWKWSGIDAVGIAKELNISPDQIDRIERFLDELEQQDKISSFCIHYRLSYTKGAVRKGKDKERWAAFKKDFYEN
jgi:hypothetical protein